MLSDFELQDECWIHKTNMTNIKHYTMYFDSLTSFNDNILNRTKCKNWFLYF